MINLRSYWLFFLLLLVITGCNQNKAFEEYKKFDNLSWNRFNFLEFEVLVEDTESEFDVYISLRHLPEFFHNKLPINLTIYSPSGEMRTADHLIELSDVDGNSLSKCVGDFCDVSILVRKEISFYESGTYTFRIENKWQKVELPGIMEVGLILERVKDQ